MIALLMIFGRQGVGPNPSTIGTGQVYWPGGIRSGSLTGTACSWLWGKGGHLYLCGRGDLDAGGLGDGSIIIRCSLWPKHLHRRWNSGTILASPDGTTWTTRSSGTSHHLTGVAYATILFVAVGDNGTLLTSSDGVAWTVQSSRTHHWLKKIAWGGQTFVAVGDGGTILSSPDGEAWNARDSGTGGHLDGIAYGGNTFVAVGDTPPYFFRRDALERERCKNDPRMFGVAYGNGTSRRWRITGSS